MERTKLEFPYNKNNVKICTENPTTIDVYFINMRTNLVTVLWKIQGLGNLHFQSYEVKLVFDSKDFSIFVGKKKNCAAFDTESLFSLTPYLFWATISVV